MDSAKQIIIKFTSDFPHLFNNMQKYLPLINNLLQDETQNKFYMETIHEGLLFIYKDFQTFFLMNKPYPVEKFTKFMEMNKTQIQINPFSLFENIIDESTFPKSGVQFRYKIYCAKKEEIADLLFLHFQSFLHEDVERLEHPEFDLILLLNSFASIVVYNNLVVSMYSGILTQEIKSTEKTTNDFGKKGEKRWTFR